MVCARFACAAAEASNSYLGCDYLAVDLPNALRSQCWLHSRITTGCSPGPDSASPLKSLGPNGELANLVGETTVTGQAMGFNPIPPSETIRSEVRDANDMVVASGMMTADELEVPAGGTAVILLPRRMGPLRTSSIRQDAYRIKSSAPVALYQFSPYCCTQCLSTPVYFSDQCFGHNVPICRRPLYQSEPSRPHRTARHQCRRSIGCNRSHSHSARRCSHRYHRGSNYSADGRYLPRHIKRSGCLTSDGNLGRSLRGRLNRC